MDAGSGEDQRCVAPARPEVIDEVVAGEAVIVHLGTGRYFALNPAATELWAWSASGRSLADLRQVHETSSEWTEAAEVLFRQWLGEGLLIDAPPDRPTGGSEAPAPSGAGRPEMRTFSDLEDLLLLDPIHDVRVGEDGLPVTGDPR